MPESLPAILYTIVMTQFYRRYRTLLLLPLLLALAACSPIALLNLVISEDGYKKTADINYGDAPRNQLDVYTPDSEPAGAPVVVFFYGGNWEHGARGEYLFVAEALTSRGFVTVVPDHRLYPEVRFPVFLEDSARAVKWVKDNIASHGGDPERIFLMGHSSGAYNAAMLAIDGRFLRNAGIDAATLNGFIGLAGPYDFLPLSSNTLKAIFNTPQGLEKTQPINFVSGNEPPMLLLHGSSDETVRPRNSSRLAARVRERGGEVTHIVYDDVSHVRIVGALASPFRDWAPVLDDVARFIRAHANAKG
ncbi:MAG: alpha/beta hydrolase [Burkholderiales bacterium]